MFFRLYSSRGKNSIAPAVCKIIILYNRRMLPVNTAGEATVPIEQKFNIFGIKSVQNLVRSSDL